jgi:hypothetical protein
VTEKTAEKVEGLLAAGGADRVCARYPYDLFAPRYTERLRHLLAEVVIAGLDPANHPST